jgi:outer membrane immunogenic protein
MRRLLLGLIATVSTIAVTQFASAADMPVKAHVSAAPPIYNWTGLYVGVEGGGAWGSSTHEFPGGTGTHGPFNVNGGLLGGTIGYNWQMGQLLAGVEGDISWASVNGSTIGLTTLCTGGPCTTKLTWISTVRGRIGYVAGAWMPYITGGAAFGNVNTCENLTCSSDTHTGWTIGGGVETKLMANWSAKAEYLYADLSRQNAYFFIAQHTVSLTENIFRLGLNYKF